MSKAKEISLGTGMGDFIVEVDGKRVRISADGGTVQVFERMDVEVVTKKQGLAIGDKDAAGNIYAGFCEDKDSPRYGKGLWVSRDIRENVTIEEAQAVAQDMGGELPTARERAQVFNALGGAQGYFWTCETSPLGPVYKWDGFHLGTPAPLDGERLSAMFVRAKAVEAPVAKQPEPIALPPAKWQPQQEMQMQWREDSASADFNRNAKPAEPAMKMKYLAPKP
jgi:hypothetical protein